MLSLLTSSRHKNKNNQVQEHPGAGHIIAHSLVQPEELGLSSNIYHPTTPQSLSIHWQYLVEDGRIRGHFLHGRSDLVKVLSLRELIVPVRVEQPKVGVQLLAVLAGELGPDAVQRDIESPSISLQRGRQRPRDSILMNTCMTVMVHVDQLPCLP